MKRNWNVRSATGAAVLLPALALGTAACEQQSAGPDVGADIQDITTQLGELEERVGTLEEDMAAAGDANTDLAATDSLGSELYENPERYVGQQVTVSGQITEMLEPGSFVLSGDDVLGDGLLVVESSGGRDRFQDGAVVQVTGMVREGFTVADAEAAVGVDLDNSLYGDYADQHYITAQSVSEAPGSDS